jgi:hypothetical protein
MVDRPMLESVCLRTKEATGRPAHANADACQAHPWTLLKGVATKTFAHFFKNEAS